MKFKIRQLDKKKEKSEPTATLYFDKMDDKVCIRTIAENGSDRCLLIFNPNGTFTRCGSIEKSTGFKVSKNGYLKEQK